MCASHTQAAATAAKNKRKKPQKPSSHHHHLGSKGKTQFKDKTKKKKNRNKNNDSNSRQKNDNNNNKNNGTDAGAGKTRGDDVVLQWPTTASQQLKCLVKEYEWATGVQLSSLEMDSLEETCMIGKCLGPAEKSITSLVDHMKVALESWKDVLCEKHLQEGQIDPGNPALLVISSSALRSLELLRELRPFTKECHAAKLFSKHMKIEEQVSFLKNRVNIASGTPSRIKKLIDMEALGLSRLAVIVLDMQPDVKGYSLFNLPQVRDEFWDLYKSYFHQPLLQGNLRVCLYGPIPENGLSKKRKHDE